MQRRALVPFIVAAVVGLVVLVSTASCDSAGTRMVSSDQSVSGTSAGFIVGSDAPVPASLPVPGPPADGEAQFAARRQAVRGTVAAKAASVGGAEPSPEVALPAQTQQAGGMLIRSGQAMIEVDSLQVGIARVRRLAQQTGALVANTAVQTGREQQRSASLELRIPSDRFDSVVNGLAPIGKVESVNISAQDVGEEFVDLTARLANARRLEVRLIELLANRTGRLNDVLTVERELARVREQIERYEGRLRYLQSRVAVSSLTVVVHEPPPVVATHPGENVIADAFVEAWRRFVFLTAGIIASLGVLVPVAAIGFGVFVVGRRYLAQKPRSPEQVAAAGVGL
jgi:uncharacterized protein DUF4349